MMPGGMNPAQVKRMMKQLGIKSEDIPAKRVVIEAEGKNIVIENPSVTAVDMKGQITYTVMGEAKEEGTGIPEDDVKMVAEQAGCSKEDAEKALEKSGGDIAKAIMELKK